jgi:hypothetical protein
MIKMKNDLLMEPGEKVVLSFDYIVDETQNSAKI